MFVAVVNTIMCTESLGEGLSPLTVSVHKKNMTVNTIIVIMLVVVLVMGAGLDLSVDAHTHIHSHVLLY